MDITATTGAALFDEAIPIRRASSGQGGFDKLVCRSIDDQEEEQRAKDSSGDTGGIGLPGPSSEQQKEIERLKNEAMQIAAKSDGELSTGDESRIRDIQSKIRKLGGMPLSENVAEQAKQSARQNRIEMPDDSGEEEQAGAGRFQTADGEWNAGSKEGGLMLRQKALVTAVKSAGLQASDFKGRS